MPAKGRSHARTSCQDRLHAAGKSIVSDDASSPSQPGPRQTLGYLRNLFESRGIHLKNKLGQSFLIDLNLLDVIIRAAELTRDDFVLEVGTGTGSLTTRLAEQAGTVLSVEIDMDFVVLAERAVAGRKNVTLLHMDVLKNKNQINANVLDRLREL